MNQYNKCDYPTPNSNGVCMGCGFSPCKFLTPTTIKINYRLKNSTAIGKWAKKPHNNQSKTHCDLCGAKLWVAPDGATIYCNNEHGKTKV